MTHEATTNKVYDFGAGDKPPTDADRPSPNTADTVPDKATLVVKPEVPLDGPSTQNWLATLSKKELVAEAKVAKVGTRGTKAELIARILGS